MIVLRPSGKRFDRNPGKWKRYTKNFRTTVDKVGALYYIIAIVRYEQ
jgi:hypothetical protein